MNIDPTRHTQMLLRRSLKRRLKRLAAVPLRGEELWASVRETLEEYLLSAWRAGKMVGQTPQQAFFVRCDRTTMTQADLDAGRLVVLVGIAPLRPAEFVLVRIDEMLLCASGPCP